MQTNYANVRMSILHDILTKLSNEGISTAAVRGFVGFCRKLFDHMVKGYRPGGGGGGVGSLGGGSGSGAGGSG